MNKKTLLLTLLLASSGAIYAQKSGGISQGMMSEMQKKAEKNPANKALFNAITTNSIDNLAKTYANSGSFDSKFSHETTKQSIHDQKSSGRCWMFTGFNVLRSDFARNSDSLTVEYSHAYLFFYDQLEKANLMLQSVVDNAKLPLDDHKMQFFFKNPVNDGGTFCGVMDLVDKYGLVPMSVQPETYSAENTSRMGRIVSSKLREFGLELREMANKKAKTADIQKRKTQMLGEVYNILSLTLGEPVKEFTYAFRNKKGEIVGQPKTYTPMSFYKETINEPLTGKYIMVMNDPRNPYYKTYEIETDRHMYDGQNWKYLNLPMEDIYKIAIASIKGNTKMYSSYDVGKQLDRKKGYLDTENYDYGTLFNTTFPMDKAQRISTFDSGSTHAMTLSAVDLDKNGNPIKWKVENSWGSTNGVEGCLIMTNRWFDEYMFRLVVEKQFVPQNLIDAFNTKPIMLTEDDPLFSDDM